MTREEAKSCICTIKMLQRLAYNIHGVMDVIDADNCKKIIKALEQEPVLDKIRAEIEELKNAPPCFDDMFEYKYAVDDVLAIIDEYKSESEVNNERRTN
jgi:hypothetical protein